MSYYLSDNAILKLKHNGLPTLILTCAASNDLNPVCYAVWGAVQKKVYNNRSFTSVQELKSEINCHKRFLTEVLLNGGVA